jgi:hypothetical protein
MKRIRVAAAIALVLGCAGPSARAASEVETKASVPELSAFHEVIHPMWHEAWPARDTTTLRALWPEIRRHVAAIEKAELPGILRDKKEAWAKGVARLQAAEGAYGAALAQEAVEPKLAAAEEMHAAYEGLVRATRPPMAELARFHEVLYRIYHAVLPEKDEKALNEALPTLSARMDTLAKATLPARWAAARERFEKARRELAVKVEKLRREARKAAWQAKERAIEEMHEAYRQLEGVFE